MELSKRLMSVASEVSEGNRLADIGTDHGYIPIFLVKKKIIPSAIAMDVNEGPLKRAETHIKEEGLSDKITTRKSNGLLELKPEEADSIVIAGMGGALMEEILTQGSHVLKEGKELILQPQSEIFKVRHCLHRMGYQIIKEKILEDDHKIYFVLKAVPGKQVFAEEYLYEYGEFLLKEKNLLMMEYLQKEQMKYRKLADNLKKQDTDGAKKRIREIEKKLKEIEKAYHDGM